MRMFLLLLIAATLLFGAAQQLQAARRTFVIQRAELGTAGCARLTSYDGWDQITVQLAGKPLPYAGTAGEIQPQPFVRFRWAGSDYAMGCRFVGEPPYGD